MSLIETAVNYELKLVENWLNCNKPSLNVSKTDLIIFKPLKKNDDIAISIKLNGKKLKLKDTVTYVGVILDD